MKIWNWSWLRKPKRGYRSAAIIWTRRLRSRKNPCMALPPVSARCAVRAFRRTSWAPCRKISSRAMLAVWARRYARSSSNWWCCSHACPLWGIAVCRSSPCSASSISSITTWCLSFMTVVSPASGDLALWPTSSCRLSVWAMSIIKERSARLSVCSTSSAWGNRWSWWVKRIGRILNGTQFMSANGVFALSKPSVSPRKPTDCRPPLEAFDGV